MQKLFIEKKICIFKKNKKNRYLLKNSIFLTGWKSTQRPVFSGFEAEKYS
jgi:hypothetical protein